jgi:hypothetical protein
MRVDTSPSVPVVLPLVDVRIDEAGTASVRVDNARYDAAEPLDRDGVGRVLQDIAGKLGPVRVRVTESDESVFTDVVLPTSARDAPEATSRPQPGLSGAGFLPEEQVDVAVIVAQRTADGDGRTQLRLPPAALAGRSGTVVLLGRKSGTFAICESS